MNLNTKITRERPELKTILLLFFRRFHVIALYFFVRSCNMWWTISRAFFIRCKALLEQPPISRFYSYMFYNGVSGHRRKSRRTIENNVFPSSRFLVHSKKNTPAIFDLLTFLCASAGHFWLGVRAKLEQRHFLDRFRGSVTLSRARYFTGDQIPYQHLESKPVENEPDHDKKETARF